MQFLLEKVNQVDQNQGGLESQVENLTKEKAETHSVQEQLMEELTKYQDNLEQVIEKAQQDTDDKIL